MSPLETALLSLLSALGGAFFSHYFTMQRKKRDELVELRLKAYADFINAATRLVSARRIGRVADELDELAKLNDAKTRICICGDRPVVEALAEFWEHGGTLEQELEILSFTRLCMSIRESLGSSGREVQRLNISNTLFKLQPSTYSFMHDPSYKQMAVAKTRSAADTPNEDR